MSAERVAPKVKRPPTFYTDVEVEVEPHDLERAGWVYVGKGDDGPEDATTSVERVLEIVRRWHDDHHAGPMRWCHEELCLELRERES